MDTISKQKMDTGWTACPNSIINREDLPIQARFLWIYLHSKPENWTFNPKQLQEALGISKNTFGKYRQALIDAGYLVTEQTKIGNKFGATNYHLIHSPDAHFLGSQKLSGSNLGRPKNGPISNTDISNTEKNSKTKDITPVLFENADRKKQTEFSESAAANPSVFEQQTKQLCIEHNIEWELIYNALDTWSENSGTKRTARGCIKTIHDWVRRDAAEGKLGKYQNKPSNMHAIADTLGTIGGVEL